MLRRGGAEVGVLGFRRGSGALPEAAAVLGVTHDGRLARRALSVAGMLLRIGDRIDGKPDIIIARNLEMLALAVAAARRAFD